MDDFNLFWPASQFASRLSFDKERNGKCKKLHLTFFAIPKKNRPVLFFWKIKGVLSVFLQIQRSRGFLLVVISRFCYMDLRTSPDQFRAPIEVIWGSTRPRTGAWPRMKSWEGSSGREGTDVSNYLYSLMSLVVKIWVKSILLTLGCYKEVARLSKPHLASQFLFITKIGRKRKKTSKHQGNNSWVHRHDEWSWLWSASSV